MQRPRPVCPDAKKYIVTCAFDHLNLTRETVSRAHSSEDFVLNFVPQGSSLYQGTVYEFDKTKPLLEMADDYYNFYDDDGSKLGAYFVGPMHTADQYGKHVDTSRVIYASMPDVDTKTPTMTDHQQYLYPLCYIPGIRGSRVEYKTTVQLCLLDIGNIKTVKWLWSIPEALALSPSKIVEIHDTLRETLVEYDPKHEEGPPKAVRRTSKYWSDILLVTFLKEYVIPYAKNVYHIELHGYIYHAVPGNSFHDEICLMDRSQLRFDSVEFSSKTEYGSLPTLEQWKRRHSHIKVPKARIGRLGRRADAFLATGPQDAESQGIGSSQWRWRKYVPYFWRNPVE
jgi:hypothetical protein